MAVVQQISWQNHRRTSILQSLEQQTRSLEEDLAILEDLNTKRNVLSLAQEVLTSIANKANILAEEALCLSQNALCSNAELVAKVKDEVESNLVNIVECLSETISHRHSRISSYTSIVAHTRQSIASLQEDLSSIPDEVFTLALSDLRTSLKRLGTVINPKQIVLKEHETNPHVRFVLSGLKYVVPDLEKDSISWLSTPHEKFSIPLPPVRVCIFPSDGRIKLTPHTRGHTPYAWSSTPKVHPHVLTNDEPCLGDFLLQYREALEMSDWVWVASIVRLFLERAINADTAGSQWVRYFTNHRYRANIVVDYLRFTHPPSQVGTNFYYKAVELDTPGTYVYQAYDHQYERAAQHDFPHPWNELVTN